MPVPTKKAPSTNGKAPAPSKGVQRPTLTNRGGAGLLTKLSPQQRKGLVPNKDLKAPEATKRVAKFRIAPALQHLAVAVDLLVPDPMNARLHPERNMEAIKESLVTYGQVKPLVVRKKTNIVIAGNGTLAAVKDLGWSEVAVHFVDMDETEAAGYGLADNKTAELAKWNMEVVATLDKMILEAGLPTTGWSSDELEVLRAADWVPPTVSDEEFSAGEGTVTLKCTKEEHETVLIALTMIREREGDKKLSDGVCLLFICNEWFPKPSYETEED